MNGRITVGMFFVIFQFTAAVYNQVVETKKEASFEYGFTPSESFNSRPFGLTILLNYVDSVSMFVHKRISQGV